MLPFLQLAHILEYRNDELLIKNSEELHRSSESAREIATAAKAEQEAVALIFAKAQKDSSLVKILTFVAMLYLPASLIAVSQHFFWLVILFIICMMKITMKSHYLTTHSSDSFQLKPDSTSLSRKISHDW